MKKLTALFLTVLISVFTILPAAAAEITDNKAGVYTDVSEKDWFCDYVQTVTDAGLMKGVGDSRFAPDAEITLAEVYTLAARLHALWQTGSADAADEYERQPDKPWSWGYVKYCMDKGIQPGEPGDVTQPALRIECMALLAKAVPETELPAIRAVADNAIPDLPSQPNAEGIYRLYRAGILTGVDEKGSFSPHTKVRRCETAAVVARLIDPALRCASEGGNRTADGAETMLFEVQGLTPDTPTGVGVYLDYADDDILIFRGEFGLFGYDLEKSEILFSFDLEKAIGTTNFQGSEEGAVIHISSDKTCLEVFSSGNPDHAYYIRISDGSCAKEKPEGFERLNCVLDDLARSGLCSDNAQGGVNTVMDICYTRGGRTRRIFENYPFAAE